MTQYRPSIKIVGDDEAYSHYDGDRVVENENNEDDIVETVAAAAMVEDDDFRIHLFEVGRLDEDEESKVDGRARKSPQQEKDLENYVDNDEELLLALASSSTSKFSCDELGEEEDDNFSSSSSPLLNFIADLLMRTTIMVGTPLCLLAVLYLFGLWCPAMISVRTSTIESVHLDNVRADVINKATIGSNVIDKTPHYGITFESMYDRTIVGTALDKSNDKKDDESIGEKQIIEVTTAQRKKKKRRLLRHGKLP